MTHSGAWASGLTADGTDLTRADGRILLRVMSGLGEVWEVRGVDTVIPHLAGQVARNRRRNTLTIVAEGMVAGAGANEDAQRTDLASLRQTIRALMDPTQDPYTLEATDEGGTVWTIEARPINVVWGPDDIPSYRGAVSCEWRAIGADWTPEGS